MGTAGTVAHLASRRVAGHEACHAYAPAACASYRGQIQQTGDTCEEPQGPARNIGREVWVFTAHGENRLSERARIR